MNSAETADEPATPIPAMPRVVNPEDALAAVSNVATPSDPTAVDPKSAEKYSFSIEIQGGDGKTWRGDFTNQILSIEDRMNVGLTAASMAGGIPMSSLDDETHGLIETVAHLTTSLKTKPSWFVLHGPDAIKNTRILSAVYKEVASHEAVFREPKPTG